MSKETVSDERFFFCVFFFFALSPSLLPFENTRRMVETNYTNVIKYMRRDFIFLTLELSLMHCMHTHTKWLAKNEKKDSRSCVRYVTFE